MRARAVWFTGPWRVEVRDEPVREPGPGEVRVRTRLSAVSRGTELLVLSGAAPAALAADEHIGALAGALSFPLKYGYGCVGEVEAAGPGTAPDLVGRTVFAFHPHQDLFCLPAADLRPVPEDLAGEDALFFAAMETAVTLVLDGRPFLGARVVVFGLGVVGLLATALLARFPLEVLAGIDPAPLRRKIAREAGAHAVFPPPEARPGGALLERLGAGGRTAGADLVLETSGVPEALDAAVGVAGFSGTVVVGSWYGTRRVSLDLGSAFHRRRLRLVSSQVSTLAPEATGRWSRNRRTGTTWEWIRRLQPGRYLTHRFPLEAAPEAYEFLRGGTGEALQVALVHQG